MDRATVEKLLDDGRLMVRMRNGNSWKVRRNGKTQTWKTRPAQFRIPAKAGLRTTFQITDVDLLEFDKNFHVATD
jgi:hypothetical protein